MNNITTGYWPRRLYFDGDVEKYELWEVKFLGHLRLQNLLHVINDSTADADGDDNAKVFAELVLVLDDRSLSLIIRDAKDDGNVGWSERRKIFSNKKISHRITWLLMRKTQFS